MSRRGIERYSLPNHHIESLDLEALRVLKAAKGIGSSESGVEPMIDAAYVLKVLEEMAMKLNAIITQVNSDNYDEKIQTVASKLNQVVSVVNRHTSRLAEALSAELQELEEDLPK